jgi:hypothetical protein
MEWRDRPHPSYSVWVIESRGESSGPAKKLGWSAMSRGGATMAHIMDHPKVEDLEQRLSISNAQFHRFRCLEGGLVINDLW